MIAYILRGHIRMYCFYFVFTGGCGPINGELVSWGTYKQQYTASSSWCCIPPFLKSSTKCEILQRQMAYPGRPCMANTTPWEDALLAKSR